MDVCNNLGECSSNCSNLARPVVIDNQANDDTWYTSDPGAIYDVDFSDTGGSLLAAAQYTVWSSTAMTGSQILNWTNITIGINNTSYTTNWGVNFASLTQGINYVSVRVTDNAGAISNIATDVFYIKKDTSAPTTTDNWTDNWTSAQTVTVTLTPTDSGSGIQTTYYCIDTANTCTPTTPGVSISITCALWSICSQYVRYYSIDNVNQSETIKYERVIQNRTVIISINGGTNFNNARQFVRDSVGNLYFPYSGFSGTSQIFVAKSTDNGNTWSDIGGAPIQTIEGYHQQYPSIAVDSQNNLHVVWCGTDSGNPTYCQIKYSKYSSVSLL